MNPSPQPSVIIIGGGLAGLAAAVSLGKQGYQISLFESRPRLGGRATSIEDQQSSELIDNCQHVAMGSCTNYLHFCESIDVLSHFSCEPALNFIDREGTNHPLTSSWLPAPLHLSASFSRVGYLSWHEKRLLGMTLWRLAQSPQPPDSGLFIDWLALQHQSENLISQFWQVVIVSALSESLGRVAFGPARKVFLDGFLRNRDSWQVWLPTVPLSQLYDQALNHSSLQSQVQVHLKSGVDQILLEANRQRVSGIKLRDGSVHTADHVILAVSAERVLELLPDELKALNGYQSLQNVEHAPISSVHLWYDRSITNLRHAVFLDRLSQWMFNRSQIQNLDSESWYYQVVISDSRDLRAMSQAEIIDRVDHEMKSCFPDADHARLIHSRVLTEHKAVFSVTPEFEASRVSQRTPIKNFFLAGDWTQTGWPATMESAVRSGYLAAEGVLDHDGNPLQLLQPDLPISWLNRRLGLCSDQSSTIGTNPSS